MLGKEKKEVESESVSMYFVFMLRHSDGSIMALFVSGEWN